jgi:protein-S-isoprenylcysteine O-methyltransferase Ste14
MGATKFEFEQRFWIFGTIFGLGFALTFFDHTYVALWLLHLIAPSVDPESAKAIFLLRLIFGAGAVLLLFAALFRTWATAYLRTEVVHDASQHSEALVADGPYRYVRNPLYLANIPMAAGIGVMASRLGWIFIVIAMWLFVYRLILREESGLLETQGESYKRYLQAVPRLWPAFSPRVPASGARPRWAQAIAGEMIFWLFGLAVLCFAISLNIKLTGAVLAVGFAFYFIVVPRLIKRAAPVGPGLFPPG